MSDYQNYTNVQFQAALKDSLAAGPLADASRNANATACLHHSRIGCAEDWRGDYSTTIQSWWEQRAFATNAISAIANAEAAAEAADPGGSYNLGVPLGWAAELTSRVAALSDVKLPTPAALVAAGYVKVDDSSAPELLHCAAGGIQVGLDSSGAIVNLKRGVGSPSWANATRPIGQFLYQTFDVADYYNFMAGPGGFGKHSGTDGSQCTPGPANESAKWDDLCANFDRWNMSGADPKHVEATPSVASLWFRNGTDGCAIAAEQSLDPELHTHAGAPKTIWTLYDLAPLEVG
jgi:hypothetical protein